METGSLISIRQNVKDILICSEEESLSMYPMDFEEFLWAFGLSDVLLYDKVLIAENNINLRNVWNEGVS